MYEWTMLKFSNVLAVAYFLPQAQYIVMQASGGRQKVKIVCQWAQLAYYTHIRTYHNNSVDTGESVIRYGQKTRTLICWRLQRRTAKKSLTLQICNTTIYSAPMQPCSDHSTCMHHSVTVLPSVPLTVTAMWLCQNVHKARILPIH